MTRSARIRLDTKRRLTGGLLAGVVAVAVVVPFLVWHGARTIISSNEGKTVTPSGPPAAQLPSTPVGLLIRIGPDGHARSFDLITSFPNSLGGFVVQVPADLRVDIAEHGSDRLAAAFDLGGEALVKLTLESFLQIAIQSTSVVDPSGLISLLQPYQPFHFTVDQPVLNHRSDGRTETVLPVGDVALEALDVPRFLDARLDGQSELDVLPREESFWRAVVDSVKAKQPAASAALDSAAAWVASLAAGTHVVTTVATDQSGPADGLPGFKPDVVRARLLAAQAMPGAVSPLVDGKRYRIINTTGDPNLTLVAVRRVLFFGGNLIAAGDTASPAASTTFDYADDANADVATSLVKIFKIGAPRRVAQPIEGIDVTITIGRDFAAVAAAEAASDATSTTTSAASTSTTVTKG